MQVRTTPLFEQTLDRFVNCYNDYYGKDTVRAVFSAIKHYRILLREQPCLGAKEPILYDMPTEFRHIVIPPNFKLIYAIENDAVFLIDLWDTRQSPSKLCKRIL